MKTIVIQLRGGWFSFYRDMINNTPDEVIDKIYSETWNQLIDDLMLAVRNEALIFEKTK